jgi:predicted unusual protein kinase regulating ubiquinone biosynthesis (AarF/ABC1/UbiB family)
MSETTADFNEASFRRQIGAAVAEQANNTLCKIAVGRTLLSVARNAGENGLFAPPELALLGKTILQLDEIGRHLDPEFDPSGAVRRHASEILNQRVRKDLTISNLFSSLLELKNFFGQFPGRMNRILDTVANAELELKVRTMDVHLLIEGVQKVANRITTGLILAALIVGASLLMQVDTTFLILGYPGFAMILFLAAAGLGFYLVISILVQDHRSKRERQLRAK